MLNIIKNMFDHPLGFSLIYVNFHSEVQKNSTCVYTGKKIAQQAWKIAQAASVRFYKNACKLLLTLR